MNGPPLQTQFIIWSAFLASPLLLGVVLNFAAPGQSAQEVPGQNLIFPLLALSASGMALILPDRLPLRPPGQLGGASAVATPMIVGLAFAESVATLGFVYGMMTGSTEVYVPYAVVSLALMAYRMPRTLR